MISKVIRGKSFYGACRYVTGDKRRAAVLAAEGVREGNYGEMARDFEAQRRGRALQSAVFHGILSFYPGEKLGDETLVQIAAEYLRDLGVRDTQYVVTKHTDKEHLHLHILANMVDNSGGVILDSYLGLRSKKVAEKLTLKYRLRIAKGKDLARTNLPQLNGREAARYEVYRAILEGTKQTRSLEELQRYLETKGIETIYKYKGKTGEVQGISFKLGAYTFKGSEVDRQYSYAKLTKAFEGERKERREMTSESQLSWLQKGRSEEQEKAETVTPSGAKTNDLLATLFKPEEQLLHGSKELLPKKRKKKKRQRRM